MGTMGGASNIIVDKMSEPMVVFAGEGVATKSIGPLPTGGCAIVGHGIIGC